MSRSGTPKPVNSPIFLRSYNERFIYNLVRTNGSPSRADVVRLTNLTFPSVSRMVDTLIKAGLVTETRQRRGGMGKPPTELEVNETRAFSVGVAYDHDCLRAVLIDIAGNVAERWQETLPEPDAATLQQAVASAVEQLGAHEKASGRALAGVGLALPASVVGDVSRGDLFTDGSEPAHPRAITLSRQLGLPVLVDTGATAGAVGERWLGSGRALDNFYYLALSDEVRGTLMMHGRPYMGSRGYAGALGPAAAVRHPDASELSTAVPRLLVELRAAGRDTDAGTLERLLSDGDEPLLRWLDETSEQLAPLLMATEYLLDPQAFVLGGILPSPLANALLERLAVLTRGLRGPAKAYAPEFLRGMSGDDALAVGAATLPLYHALSPDALAGGRFGEHSGAPASR